MSISFPISTVLYFCLLLIIPGFVGSLFFRKRLDSFSLLLSLSLSYSLFSTIISIYTSTSLPLIDLKSLITRYYIVFLLIFIPFLLVRTTKVQPKQHMITKEFLSGLLIISLVVIHHMFTGPYDQIPGDVLTHLIRLKETLILYSDNINNSSDRIQSLLTEKPQIWYHLIAISTQDTGLNSYQILNITTLFTKVIFVLSLYLFGLIIFANSPSKVIVSLLSTVFACLHFGVNIFSYIQYYSFAPAILAFSLYLTGVAVFIKYLNGTINIKNSVISFFLLFLILATILLVHYQEALFLIITIYTMSVIATILNYKNKEKKAVYLVSLSLSILGFICFILCYIYIQKHFDLNPNNHWKLWEFGKPISWLPSLKALNLKYQGIEVLTYWGALIYLFFFIAYKEFKNNIYLIAGMLSPFITVLNPIFIDFITRIAPVNFVYRLLYIVPIYYIAGFCSVLFVKNVINNPSKRIYSGVLLLSLILVFFIPINHSSHQLGFSRVETLRPVAKNEGHDRFEDLIHFLDEQPNKYILTDPVLGYAINAFTHHKYYSTTFRKNTHKFTFDDYSDFPVSSKRSGWLLIINNRNNLLNTKSRVGMLSRHWSEDIFDVNSYYPENLIQHINNNPKLFIPIWSSQLNDIKVYFIKKNK